jgi:molybdenum cofactor cytidylyltransferase
VQAVKLGVVILAAGASKRMGKPKLLLPWGKTSVLGHIIFQWQGLGAGQISVVCAAQDRAVSEELDKLGFAQADRIINPIPGRGMFSSIQCAAAWDGWKEILTHWVIALGDQPQLPSQLLRLLIQFAEAHPERVCQPSYRGRARHPILLPKAVFAQLTSSAHAQLKEFLRTLLAQPAFCEVDEPSLEIDLDEPADYEEAVRRYLR